MTDKEEKAIEYWKEQLKAYKKEIEQRQNDEFKGYGTPEDIAKLKYCNLHTILNLIEKQQKEIEKLKNRIKHQDKEMTKAVDYTFELNKEIEKQDKIIDEMAQALKGYANLGVLIKCPAEYDGKYNYKYCKIDITKDRTEKTNKLCINCIKEYFKSKVNSSEQN